MFDGLGKKITIKGSKLEIVYHVREKKEKIILKGKIECDALPTMIDKASLNGDDELVVIPLNSEVTLNEAQDLIKTLLKL